MIKLQIIGNIGADSTIGNYNGKQVINFSVAVNQKYKNAQGETVETSEWISCSYWSESKVHEYLKKGIKVYVEGMPSVREYTDRSGQKKSYMQCNVYDLYLLTSKNNNNANQTQTEGTENSETDSLPF